MLKYLKLSADKTIPYSLKKHSKAKRIKISVFSDNSVLVTLPKYRSFKLGETFAEEKKDWIAESLDRNSQSPDLFRHAYGMDFDKVTPKDVKLQALTMIHSRLEYYSRIYNYKYEQVRIKRMKSRWGSCSKNGNLNFNFKIFFLPERLRDYVIVHELCHLQEFNHSRNYWELVERMFPDHKHLKKELNKYL